MMTNSLILFLVFFLGLGIGIVALVFVLLFIVSYLGGWGSLARQYAETPNTFKGALLEEKLQFRARVGLISFGALVTARSYEQGIELTVRFPFSPPLFFPWNEIHDYKRVNQIPFPQMDQFTVGNRRIRLSNRLEELSKRKEIV